MPRITHRHAQASQPTRPDRKAPQRPKTALPKPSAVDTFDMPTAGARTLGGGDPSVDFNGTKYTRLEGSASNSQISIGKGFDPLAECGIALTRQQAVELGVEVGDKVCVRDAVKGTTVEATFHDSAGRRRKDPYSHFEVSPALADALGIRYRNRAGKVVDAVTNTESLVGRFFIENKPEEPA